MLPAKLARPSASGLIPRERLFARLDQTPASRITWISGPGGAGKTSFVSTYIEARGLDCLWYQVDASDADLAVTTHYLRLAVADFPGEPLPGYTAADHVAFEAFARRFFEAFAARLATPIVIALDNYQEVATDARFHDLVVALLDHLPEHARVVVLSRTEPPPALARWSLHPDFATIEWGEVQFLREEAAALARHWGLEGAEHVDALLAVSRGWAAGMVLMLRAAQRGVDLGHAQREPPRQLFDYFASQIWSRIPSATQGFLYRTAFLRHMTAASAQALTGEARAGRILADLNADNFFTDRRPGAAPVYEYHPLFREFLADRAAEALDAAALSALKGRTAALLEEAGELAAAADLLIGAADWAGLAAFVQRHARWMIGHARFQTLRSWLDAFPASHVAAQPWLLLSLGLCKAVARDATFRDALERSAALFDATGDLVGSCAARGWLFRPPRRVPRSRPFSPRCASSTRATVQSRIRRSRRGSSRTSAAITACRRGTRSGWRGSSGPTGSRANCPSRRNACAWQPSPVSRTPTPATSPRCARCSPPQAPTPRRRACRSATATLSTAPGGSISTCAASSPPRMPKPRSCGVIRRRARSTSRGC